MIGYELILKDKENINIDNPNVIKIGGKPTYVPSEESDGYFLMEIYNIDIIGGREDILCWQIYQDTEFGGEPEVIEITKGAKLYDDNENIVKLRRWITEYDVTYIEKNWPDEVEGFYDDDISQIKGNPGEEITEWCDEVGAEYLGVIYEMFCPYGDFSFGSMWMVIGMVDGTLVVE